MTRPINVLHLVHALHRAGAEVNLHNLAVTSNDAINQQQVVGWNAGGPVAEDLRRAGVTVHAPLAAKPWKAVGPLRDLVQRENIDVIHAHMSDSGILSGIVNRLTGVPFIVTHHDGTRLVPDMSPAKTMIHRSLLKWAVRKASFQTGVTQTICDRLVVEMPSIRNRVRLVNNTVTPPDAVDLRSLDTSRPIRILGLGRYIPLKRFETLIRASKILAERGLEFQIDIVGGGELQENYHELTAALEVSDKVHIRGSTDTPKQYFQQADIYVSTSEYEGASIALLEAMSWGLPIVASDVPGNRELVREGQNGQLFPFDNERALAEKILGIAADREWGLALGQQARAEVKARFGAEHILGCYAKLYVAALGDPDTLTEAAIPQTKNTNTPI